MLVLSIGSWFLALCLLQDAPRVQWQRRRRVQGLNIHIARNEMVIVLDLDVTIRYYGKSAWSWSAKRKIYYVFLIHRCRCGHGSGCVEV